MSTQTDEQVVAKDGEGVIVKIGGQSVEEFTKNGFKTLMESLKIANSLPAGRDRDFYNTFESYKSAMNLQSNNIISNMNSILRSNEVSGSMRNNVIENKTEILVEACDVILERVANNIDEMNGIRKSEVEPVVFQTVSVQLPVNGSWNRTGNLNNFNSTTSSGQGSAGATNAKKSTQTIRLITAENILRPQKFFKDKIDNRRNKPWEPRIKEKPNSLKPLAIFLEETEFGHQYSHPYEFELDRFSWPEENLKKGKVITPKLLEDTPLIEIDKPEQLDELLNDLRGFQEIAVDLEHHSYRSFMGITCLMQISTLEKDYLIDTVALRDKLYVLNEIFTDPKIVKIFHGASNDVEWLQRDLSLYVVNMFDTHLAAKMLEYSGLSLSHLMQRFCNLMPNKQFQLADWRIRPLPAELKSYAREDTHYLIYIYQKMRNELIEKAHGQNNLLKSVIQSSTQLCKKRFLKLPYTEESHLNLYRRCNRMFDNRQLFALKELYKWRDQISREEDESTGYVLPNNMLLDISDRLPREMQGILACCNPVPPLVRANLLDLHKIILKALEKPFELPILKEDTRARGTMTKVSKINIDSPLHCPHDLTKMEHLGDNLPTLLGGDKLPISELSSVEIETNCSGCSIFNTPENSDTKDNSSYKNPKLTENKKFLSPFARYKLIKPFIQARENKIAEEKTKTQNEENAAKQNESSNTIENKATGESDTTEPSDADRIQAIREHFLELNRRTEEQRKQEEEAEALVEISMAAHMSAKRKRDENLYPEKNIEDMKGYREKRPKLDKEKKGKKRKQGGPPNTQVGSPLNKKHKQNERQNYTQAGPSQNQRLNNYNQGQKKQKNKPQGNNNQYNKNYQQPQGRNHGPITPKKKTFNKPESNITPYDYSMVDFRQFGGGAGSAQNQQGFKAKFKARKSKGKTKNKGQNKQSIV